MANTTFKGPVRSQNGFQQLVDGVWTPMGGGGGGGGGAPFSVHNILIPFDGSDTEITLPAPTQVGQTFWIFSQMPPVISGPPSGNMQVNFTATPTANIVSYGGWVMEDNSTIQTTNNAEFSPPFIFFSQLDPSVYQIQLTYMGTTNVGGGDISDYYSYTFWIYPLGG